MAFILKSEERSDVVFDITATGGDVNLHANGILIAYIDGDSGRLYLPPSIASERAALPGLQFDTRGRLALAE